MNKITIAFAGLYHDDNIGDLVIAKCTETLFTRSLPKERLIVRYLSLNHFCFHPMSQRFKLWLKVAGLFNLRSNSINEHIITFDYMKYFESELKGVNLVVIVGGGLIEFTGGRFVDGMYAITLAGNKFKIPVIINASGVEGYDEKNKKCLQLKKMLQQPSLTYISTRDDYDTLKNKYLDGNSRIVCEKVADPAVWASEIYNIQRNGRSKIIGIGIIRNNIFGDYGLNLSSNQVKSLYIDVVKQLREDGEIVHLFTNGAAVDNKCANEIVETLVSQGINIQVDIPTTDEDLIKTIAQYKGVIAGRLHSCIISYSLNIPAVGLVWNDKLTLWGDNIGAGDYYIQSPDLKPDIIISQLKKAMTMGYNQQIRNVFRNTILRSIEHNVAVFMQD